MEKDNSVEKLKKHLSNLFRARFPFVYISTWEETRVVDLIQGIAVDESLIKTKREVYVWTQTKGMQLASVKTESGDTNSALGALKFIEQHKKPAIFILEDFHVNFGVGSKPVDYQIVRKVRDLVQSLKEGECPQNVVFVSPILALPDDLQKDVTIVDFDLPSIDELTELLNEIIDANEGNPNINISLTESEKVAFCKAAQGLTLQEAENAFARAMVEKGALTLDEVSVILDEKNQVIKKTGILEFVKSELSIDDIGGLENLKRWLMKRNRSWLDEAKQYRLPAPKGVLITGIAGCGKSLTAKAISAMWTLPLLRLDMGKIFSGIVGSSEENMRKAIKTAEAVSPSILWIDEIEKGFGGTVSSTDSGTTTRIFGTFLTWMQEKTKPVFVVATANKIDALPAELLRKGRFDEIFFVDLPTRNERKDIFALHLKKRLEGSEIGRKVDYLNESLLYRLADETEGFGGAEIEQVIVAALFEAFADSRELQVDDLLKAIRNTVPLSVTQSEQIMQIREWANMRAVAATAAEDRHEYEYILDTSNENSSKNNDIKQSAHDSIKRNRGGRAVDF